LRGDGDKLPARFYAVAMSRESLVEAYIAALPFAAVAIVAVPGGRCRITEGDPADGEKIVRQILFQEIAGAVRI
jgi:hypothetical protein